MVVEVAYIQPTGLSTMSPEWLRPSETCLPSTLLRTLACEQPEILLNHFIGVAAFTYCQLPLPEVKIPTPPMGRLLVNDLPAYYKERSRKGEVDGQIYPPPVPH